ncbi:hypothetical protein SO802_010920 [Lithocarpus litseifolius]|uniref:RNase H type-1 domain-containing protein n=1 Tax=Lithocarpus litseifolius TaxID=425828 RepID=A0AAW2DI70_9ROSI
MEMVVSKVEPLEMAKREKGGIRMDGTMKPTATEVDSNDLTCHRITARTFKAKYFPRGSVQECISKPHHSWIWKNIIKLDNPKLREGIWRVGRRYKETFNDQSLYNRNSGRPKPMQQPVAGPWQIILKITRARCNRTKRCSFAYEAVNMQGVSMFFGVACSTARSKGGAMFEAMVEAAIRAKHHGFQFVLFLGDDRRVVQAFRKKRSTDWLDKT